jgi:RNA polymerase sigma factor (sigma-70 family)
MPDANDMDLVRQFARDNSEAAFTELVRRHINLVYSVARRCTGDDGDARDVTQAVFIILARKAASLREKTLLTGWLYETTRFIATRLLRTNARRHAREQEAFMQSTLNETETENVWTQLAPHLETAMEKLNAADRTLLVLRFYENKTSTEAAALLGIREDAAHKRVVRAIEKLRKFFMRRGVTISGAAIAGALSANSVQAAPAGLAAIVSSTALSGTTITTAAIVAATKTIAMTTFQKTIITATVVVTAGAGLFEAHQNSESQKQIQNLQQQQNSLNEQLAQLQRERDDATNQLGGLLAENAQLKSNSNQHELLKLRGEVAAARRAASDTAAKTPGLRNGSEQSQEDYQRNQTRADLDQFFKLTHLSPEKADQYVNLEVEMKRRQDERLKGLLSGTLSVADAVRQRDQDKQAQEDQRRALLGPDGSATLQSIADGMREGVAKRLTGAVQAGMVNTPLTQEQSDRLQSAIKAEVAANTMDDTDLFRPVDEWTRMVTDHQQHVLQAASEFLTPTQQETLQFLERANLAQLLQQREQRRKAIGINQ